MSGGKTRRSKERHPERSGHPERSEGSGRAGRAGRGNPGRRQSEFSSPADLRWRDQGSPPALIPRSARDDGPRESLAACEAVFAALAHASRRHILMVLHYRGGSMTAGEIASRFACSWPTTTRHLRILVEAGLITVEKQGRERVYRLDADRLRSVAGEWIGLFSP